ncbi:MAG: DUF5703 domain-containing protein [Tannerella sp.]|jgi:hypothetical protein|nr:DUF5703 domain-containing protein [Tannerella sp.]
MNSKQIFIACMIVVGAVSCRQQKTPDVSAYNVVWESQSDNSCGSMPIGNGDVGANVWVSPNGELLFYISKTDSWDGNGSLLKIGKLKLSFVPNLLASGDFRQELDLAAGTIRITGKQDGKTLSLDFRVDAVSPVIHIDGKSSVPVEMTVVYDGWRRESRLMSDSEKSRIYGMSGAPHPLVVEADTILNCDNSLMWCHRNSFSIWKETLEVQSLGDYADSHEDPLLGLAFGALVTGEGMKNRSPEILVSEKAATKQHLEICVLTEKAATADDWAASVSRLSAASSKTSLAQRKAEHEKYWNDVWNSHFILVTPSDASVDSLRIAGVTRGYALQRFINLCSGKGRMPIKFNGNIFNVDSVTFNEPFDADYRRWGGCYWWQNTRLPYFAMLYSGDFDLMKSLFGMYIDALPLAKFRTHRYFGIEGAYFPETMYFWGVMNNDNYGWSRTWTDNSREGSLRSAEEGQPAGLSQNRYIRYLWEGAIELTSLMLDYYDFTGDRVFVRDTLLPFAGEIVMFYRNRYPTDDNGKILFEPAQALETYWDITNPMPEIAGLRSILPRLIKLDETSAKLKKICADMFAELPDLPTTEPNGEKRLAAGENLQKRSNIETPELYAVFPYHLFGLGKPSLDIVKRTFEHRIIKDYHGWQQAAIMAALIGEGEQAAKMVTDNFNTKYEGSRFPAFWGPNYDWVPDQDHGNVSMRALQNMLIQTVNDSILLFPAWTPEWNVRFKVWATGNTSVEGELKNGTIVRLKVVPEHRRKDIVILDNRIILQ